METACPHNKTQSPQTNLLLDSEDRRAQRVRTSGGEEAFLQIYPLSFVPHVNI